MQVRKEAPDDTPGAHAHPNSGSAPASSTMEVVVAAITVHAFWDDEARVWVAESAHVPGLVAESPTIDALVEKLQDLIPELHALNGVAVPHATVALVATRSVHLAA